MHTVTLSPKYQLVIPRDVRESLGMRPGEKVQIFEYDGRIEIVRVLNPRDMRGFLRGINTNVPREEERM